MLPSKKCRGQCSLATNEPLCKDTVSSFRVSACTHWKVVGSPARIRARHHKPNVAAFLRTTQSAIFRDLQYCLATFAVAYVAFSCPASLVRSQSY